MFELVKWFDNEAADGKGAAHRVAIRVNGELVDDSRFFRAFLRFSGGATPEMVQRENPALLRTWQRMAEQDVLEQVVLMQAARAEGIVVSPQEIEQERRKSWGTDAYLVCGAGLRADLQEALLCRKMDVHLARHVPRPSQAQVMDAYRQRSQEFAQPARVQVHQLFHAAETPAQCESGAASMERARHEVESGRPMQHIALKSAGAITLDELGWVGAGELVPELETELFPLRTGMVTPVVQTVFGLHLIKVVARHDARIQPLAEVKQALARAIWDERRRAVREEVLQGHLQRADIQIVTESSQNPSGAAA